MARDILKPHTTRITWGGMTVVILAGLYPAFYGAYWAAPIAMGAVATGIGVWKAVQLLGELLDHLHWRDIEVLAEDD